MGTGDSSEISGGMGAGSDFKVGSGGASEMSAGGISKIGAGGDSEMGRGASEMSAGGDCEKGDEGASVTCDGSESGMRAGVDCKMSVGGDCERNAKKKFLKDNWKVDNGSKQAEDGDDYKKHDVKMGGEVEYMGDEVEYMGKAEGRKGKGDGGVKGKGTCRKDKGDGRTKSKRTSCKKGESDSRMRDKGNRKENSEGKGGELCLWIKDLNLYMNDYEVLCSKRC